MPVPRNSRPASAPDSRPGVDDGHCLVNEGTEDVVYLEVGDRTSGDAASYPEDDIAGTAGQVWSYTRKDGKPL